MNRPWLAILLYLAAFWIGLALVVDRCVGRPPRRDDRPVKTRFEIPSSELVHPGPVETSDHEAERQYLELRLEVEQLRRGKGADHAP